MRLLRISRTIVILLLAVLATVGLEPAGYAQSSSDWSVALGVKGGSLGTLIGIAPWGSDGYGEQPVATSPELKEILLLEHHVNGSDWSGPSGLFAGDIRYTPIAAGTSRTWSDFYLWAQNYAPTSANLTIIMPETDPHVPPPAGYRGHLVLDYVPSSCNYTGPTDYWLDLTAYNELALPIPVVTDPLQGTRFHLTVYAPVPEPASLAALGMGLAGIGGFAIRRKH